MDELPVAYLRIDSPAVNHGFERWDDALLSDFEKVRIPSRGLE